MRIGGVQTKSVQSVTVLLYNALQTIVVQARAMQHKTFDSTRCSDVRQYKSFTPTRKRGQHNYHAERDPYRKVPSKIAS